MAITRGRRILAVVAGIVAANVLLIVGESASMRLFVPVGFNFNDPTAIPRLVAQLPISAFLFLLATYAAGSFVGGVVATLVANRLTLRPALIVGVLLTLAGIANLAMIPHPLWFVIVSTLVYLPCAWLGARVVIRLRPVATP